MKTRLLIIIGIMIAVSSLFTIAYFTSVSYEIERCFGDTVYKDFTGEIIHRQVCIFPFTGKTITDTFLGCDEGFKQINETCIQLASDCRKIFGKGTTEMYDCLEKIEDDTNVPPPINQSAERDFAWVIDAKDELYSLGCDKPILEYLYRSSNLLDDDFDGNYFQNFIGLPDGVSKEKFEECVDFILEKRIKELKNEN